MRYLLFLVLVSVACAQPVDLKIHPVKGPTTVQLAGGLARLDVPANYLFLNRDDAIHVLQRAGNPTDGSEVGLLHPATATSRAFIVIEHAAVGHVTDTDALDADALLASIVASQAVQNEQRRTRNQPEITVTGWAETPRYDRATRRMTWAVKARSGKEELINARTRLLGRSGYLSFNLITEPAAFAQDKGVLTAVLAQAAFADGQRYEDFQPGKDKEAGKGLADLIVGGATSEPVKLPFDPKLALKVIAGVAIGGLVLFGRFRRRRVRAP